MAWASASRWSGSNLTREDVAWLDADLHDDADES